MRLKQVKVNLRSIKANFSVLGASLILSLAWAPAIASAEAVKTASDSTTTSSTTNNSTDSTSSSSTTSGNSTTQATELTNIISRGNQEIERRLTNLNSLSSLINSDTKLSAADKSLLSSEVSNAISGLTSLKTQLDAETTVTAARADVQNIVTEYRVYALVDPKIHLIRIADDQQVEESKLSSLAQILQTRITTAQNAGQQVTSLSTDLTSLNASVTSAQTTSAQVEAAVINLQPTDYDTNHSVLEGYNGQLKSARQDIESAYAQAKSIVSGLESLKTTSTSSSTSNTTN